MPTPSLKHPETRCRTCLRRRRVSGITGRCLLCEAQTPRLLDELPAKVTSVRPKERDKDKDKDKPQQIATNSSPTSAISRIPHHAIERLQLFDTFLNNAFPSVSRLPHDLARNQSLMTILRNFDFTSSALLTDAIESVCLEAAARSPGGDGAVVNYQAQDSFVRMLRRLTHALDPSSSTQKQFKGNHIAIAIMLMELRSTISDNTDIQTIMMHRRGLYQFLHHRAESFNWTTQSTKGLFENYRLQTILLRAGNPYISKGLNMPPWPVASRASTPGSQDGFFSPSSRSQWHVEAEPIPELLDQVDWLCATGSGSDEAAAELFFRVEYVRNHLAEFRHENTDHMSGTPDEVEIVDTVANLDQFDMDVEEHCYLTSSTTFTQFYRFSTHNKARNAACVWLCSCLADVALLRLLHFRPSLQGQFLSQDGISTEILEASAFSAACDLCRCVFYFSGFAASIAHADFTKLLLLAAQGVFESCGTAAEYGWTQTCLVTLDMRIKRLKASGRTTHCHVASATDHIKQRCMWSMTMPVVKEDSMEPLPQG